MSRKKLMFSGRPTNLTSTKSKAFNDRIQELLDQAARLWEMEANGYRYERVRVKPTTVKQHKRSGYWAMRPMKRKP